MATILAHPLALKIGFGGLCLIALIGYGVKRYFKAINSDTAENDWM